MITSASNVRKRSFAGNEEGTIAIIFALTLTVVTLMTGLAIDFGRIYHAERKLTGAIDAAALAAAKALRETSASDDRVKEVAAAFFEDNLKGGGGYANIRSLDIQVDRANNAVTINVETDVPTTFFNLAGVQAVSVPKSSVAIYDSKDIELGLQLDVTGSMAGRKLADLKDAVGELLDIVLPDSGNPNKVRVGLAPFAAGVNAGAYAAAVSEGRATNGCVYERRTAADQSTDIAPAGTHALKAASDVKGADPCPGFAHILPMTTDKSLLRRTVKGWSANGSTAGHLGAAWAWYLLSPNWSAIWPAASRPAAYEDGKTMKAVILMTDGIYNTVGGVSDGDNGSTAAKSKKFAEDTCLAMRDKGITVYTIGFQAPAPAKDALTKCASDASKFYDAADGDQLKAAFKSIASELNNLRLSF